MNLFDRFLQVHSVARADLQLVGLTCLLIAAKYEETCPPLISDLLYVCDNVCPFSLLSPLVCSSQSLCTSLFCALGNLSVCFGGSFPFLSSVLSCALIFCVLAPCSAPSL